MAQHDRPSLSLSEVCQILSSRYRRQLLSYFHKKNTDIADLGELVRHIHEQSEEATTAEQVRISLIHIHIPKLADYGVIEYDRRNQDVRYGDVIKIEKFLEVIPSAA